MLRCIDWDRSRVIVELGPGIGSITKGILSRMHPNAVLIAIDSNPEFITILRESFIDSRLRVVCSSATQLRPALWCHGFRSADCIVSGLPFGNMMSATQKDILQTSIDVLNPFGSLVLFQYHRRILPILKTMFPSVHRDYEIFNLPPAYVFRCNRFT